MNKGSRSTLLIAVLCILIGIAIIVVAIAVTPGGFSKIWNDAVNTNVLDKLENIGVDIPGGSKNWKNAYSPDGRYTVSDSVSGIDIDWLAGKVIVTPYSGKEIAFSETGEREITEDTALGWGIENGVLNIQYLKKNSKSLGSRDPIKTIEVLVPQELAGNMQVFEADAASAEVRISDIEVDRFGVDTASGNVYLTNITAGELDVDTASGNAFMTGVTVYGTLDVDTASGDTEVSGSAGNTKIEAASGSVTAVSLSTGSLDINTASGSVSVAGEFGRLSVDTSSGAINAQLLSYPDEIDIDTASGSVTLVVPENGGFTLGYDSGSGDLDLGLPVMMKGSRYVYGDGSCDISVDTASGDLTMRFTV